MPYIHAIEYYTPENYITNDDLIKQYGKDFKYERLLKKIGVEKRHIASKDELVSHLAIKAAKKLFNNNGISPEDIDFILLCTQSPDYILPTTACIIQSELNIPINCGALDFNLGCSGFIYGLALAKALLISQIAANVLVLTAETYSKHINPLDKSLRPMFGDGAAAVLVRNDRDDEGIGNFVLGTNGEGAQNLIIPAGGMKMPKNSETAEIVKDKHGNFRSSENLYMNGPEIHDFVVTHVPELVSDALDKNKLGIEDIDLFVFHQASKLVLDSLRKKLEIDEDKFILNIEDVGNTVSSTIPIALKQAHTEGRVKKGDRVMLVGFGVGYSWGATVITW